MKFCTIAEALASKISGEWGDEPKAGHGVNVLRTTNFTNSGDIKYDKVVRRAVTEKKVLKKRLRRGDTIIEKSGGSPTQPVGRVVFFDKDDNEIFLCNNFTSILRPSQDIEPKYLFYCLFSFHQSKRTLRYQNKTTGIINLKMDRYLETEKIPLPPLEEQKRIVSLLDQADALRRKRKESLKLLDEYGQSVYQEIVSKADTQSVNFLDLFDVKTGKLNANAATKGGEFPFFTCSKEDNYRIDTYAFDCEALILSGNNANGQYSVKYYNGKFNAYQRTYVLQLKDKDNSYPFVRIALENMLQKLQQQSIGTNTKYLTMGIFKRINFEIPNYESQQKFSETSVKISETQAKMHQQSQELEHQFNALMQKAFVGAL